MHITSWQKINKFKAFKDLDMFLNRQPKTYVQDFALCPDIVVRDFKVWREQMNRDIWYVRDRSLLTYAAYTLRHRITTKHRFALFKKQTGLTNNSVALLLGYSNNISMLTSRFRWTRIEAMLNQRDYMNELIEKQAA